MKKNIWDMRIPTLFGIFLIMIGIFSSSYLTNQGVIFSGRATSTQAPQEVRITNISDTSLTISYKTETAVLGSVNFGKDKNLGIIILDDQDQKLKTPTTHTIHSFTIKNLLPKTEYFFSIISGENIYLDNNELFSFVTGPILNSSQSNNSIVLSGKILSSDTSDKEIIVYLKTTNSQTLSTMVATDGNYMFAIKQLRTQDASSFISLDQKTLFKLFIMSNSKQSNVVIIQNQTNTVIPPITLSKDYDFSITPLTDVKNATSSGEQFPLFFSNTTSSKIPQIITPKNNESFSDQKPIFSGTALPGATIKILIQSENQMQDEVKADTNGKWIYRPTTLLSPGSHTVTITTENQNGIVETFKRSFIIFAQGSKFTQPSVAPSQIPTPTSIQILTSTPTPLEPTPTEIPTITPTPIPTQTTSEIPAPGSSEIINGVKGIALSVIGALLLAATFGFP